MTRVNTQNYTDGQINDALRARSGSRRVTFRYDLLDKNDIKIGELDGIQGKISYGDFNEIKRTASFTINEYLQRNINYLADEIKPWFILHMPMGGTVEWPLGVFLLESPTRKINGKLTGRDIGAYDKSKIIEEDMFTARYFIAAGTNYVGEITKILNDSGIVHVNILSTSLTIRADREIAIGTKKKEVINTLLGEINYTTISVDESGEFFSAPYVEPAQRPVTQIYVADSDSIIDPQFEVSLDLTGRANVFVAVAKNNDAANSLTSTYINDNPASSISTVNRGRHIVQIYEVEQIANQGTLDAYIYRIALDAASAYSKLSFKSALMPTHGSAETLYCDFPTVFDNPQKFSETAWDMDLKFDGQMTHEAREAVTL